jgi:hypothetical protein
MVPILSTALAEEAVNVYTFPLIVIEHMRDENVGADSVVSLADRSPFR